jgi:hypothetical protein
MSLHNFINLSPPKLDPYLCSVSSLTGALGNIHDTALRYGVPYKNVKTGSNEIQHLGPILHLGDYHNMHHANKYYTAAAKKETPPPPQEGQQAAELEHHDVQTALPLLDAPGLYYNGMMTKFLPRLADHQNYTATGRPFESNHFFRKMAAALYLMTDAQLLRGNSGLYSIIEKTFDMSAFPDLCNKVFASYAWQLLNILLYNRAQREKIPLSKLINELTTRVTTTREGLLDIQKQTRMFSIIVNLLNQQPVFEPKQDLFKQVVDGLQGGTHLVPTPYRSSFEAALADIQSATFVNTTSIMMQLGPLLPLTATGATLPGQMSVDFDHALVNNPQATEESALLARVDARRPLVPDRSRPDPYPDRPRRSDMDRSSSSFARREAASDLEEIVRLQQRLQSLIAKALDHWPGHKKPSSANFAAREVPVEPTDDDDADAAGLAAMQPDSSSQAGSDDDPNSPDRSALRSFWP